MLVSSNVQNHIELIYISMLSFRISKQDSTRSESDTTSASIITVQGYVDTNSCSEDPWDSNEETPKLAGIPPHVALLSELQNLSRQMAKFKEELIEV